jgi:hypothetical protein
MRAAASGLTAETARAPLGKLKLHGKFDNGAQVKLQTKGDMEFITERVVATPGSTFRLAHPSSSGGASGPPPASRHVLSSGSAASLTPPAQGCECPAIQGRFRVDP